MSTAPPPADAAFQPTRWSVVWRARGQGEAAFRALSELCAAYRYPLLCFARRQGLAESDAEDATQGFFTALLEKDLFARADPARGRLRSFLLTSFGNHLRHEHRRGITEKRGGLVTTIPLDIPGDDEPHTHPEPADPETPETLFNRAWVLQVLAAALARVEREWTAGSRGAAFQHLTPFLSGAWHTGQNFTDAAAALGITVNAARQRAALLRKDYRTALLAEIGETIADNDPAAIEEELRFFSRTLET